VADSLPAWLVWAITVVVFAGGLALILTSATRIAMTYQRAPNWKAIEQRAIAGDALLLVALTVMLCSILAQWHTLNWADWVAVGLMVAVMALRIVGRLLGNRRLDAEQAERELLPPWH